MPSTTLQRRGGTNKKSQFIVAKNRRPRNKQRSLRGSLELLPGPEPTESSRQELLDSLSPHTRECFLAGTSKEGLGKEAILNRQRRKSLLERFDAPLTSSQAASWTIERGVKIQRPQFGHKNTTKSFYSATSAKESSIFPESLSPQPPHRQIPPYQYIPPQFGHKNTTKNFYSATSAKESFPQADEINRFSTTNQVDLPPHEYNRPTKNLRTRATKAFYSTESTKGMF